MGANGCIQQSNRSFNIPTTRCLTLRKRALKMRYFLKSTNRWLLLSLLSTVLLANPVPAQTVRLEGLIEPSLIVKVGSPTAGILASVEVDRGAMVTKGQVLAVLQSGVEKATTELARSRAEMDASVEAKEAKLKYSIRRQERLEALHAKQVIPLEKMDEARTAREIAELELEEVRESQQLAVLEWRRAQEVLDRLTIYSPITGVVEERFLSSGEYVEDQPILQLARINPLYVEVFAPVEMLGHITVGMTATVIPEKPIDRQYKARVTVVDRVVDAASGTFGVRLALANPGYKLPAGLKCQVLFEGQ